ncbi:hypothetical protein ACFV4P_02500 [Kitasatospora sp. NPDC059795]|uniref:hypothetical protein n=1 Tax=Kitasatospora sp. NPDC059795 TaxID=3346949 RepID=UPI003661F0A8
MSNENPELSAAVDQFGSTDALWQAMATLTAAAASERAAAMRKVVELAGSQTAAAPILGLDQTTISRTLGRERTLPPLPADAVAALRERITQLLDSGPASAPMDADTFARYRDALGLDSSKAKTAKNKKSTPNADGLSSRPKKPKGTGKKKS